MNFNIYLKEEMGNKITRVAKKLHRSRNSIINEAVEEWLENHFPSQWPKGFFDFDPITDIPDFKELRKELKNNIPEDPLA